MRLRVSFTLFSLLFALFLSACANVATPNNDQAAVAVEVPNVPQPPAGKSVVVGQVKTNTDQSPVGNQPVYLAQVYWDAEHTKAAFALDIARSPATTSDEQGFFILNDIPPAEYVLVVGDFYGENDVVKEANGDARVYKPDADKPLNVGVVQVKPLASIALPATK